VAFEWDENKSASNLEKHGISFDEAVRVFEGVYLSHIDPRENYGEVREITTGIIAETVVTVVVHTDRDEAIRIISARKANRRERNEYHASCTQDTGRPASNLQEPD